jgi:SagB-type dehydrogenase family enzyme
VPLSAAAVGDLLRHALGLSAWKAYRGSRWSLRVNPSSGNLHPTEAYLVCGTDAGLGATAAVFHYAPERHVLEERCAFDAGGWRGAVRGEPVLLLALTSIHWREAWKYGERAFRYCQHDLGHAMAAVSVAAQMLGWQARALSEWSSEAIAALVGADRAEDFREAEPEEPGCILAIGPRAHHLAALEPAPLLDATRAGTWTGRASQLSEDHVQWTFIDEIAVATRTAGRAAPARAAPPSAGSRGSAHIPVTSPFDQATGPRDARALVLQRRSAVALDGATAIDRATFVRMLRQAMPRSGAPWDLMWWPPRVHLVLFVHRVRDLEPGLYLLPRRDGAGEALRRAMTRDFIWEAVDEIREAVDEPLVPLMRLARGDCRALAQRLSCDQEIAADGFFSAGMLAEFAGALAEEGAPAYRRLFWESGVLGQMLYLAAEAAGSRGTGIGCYYDDAVHDVLGLAGGAFQSLYHFTIGQAVEDPRLTTERGYPW